MSFHVLNTHLLRQKKSYLPSASAEDLTRKKIKNTKNIKCPSCKTTQSSQTLEPHFYVCQTCQKPLRINAYTRLLFTVDEGSFIEQGRGYISLNPFFDTAYDEKIYTAKETSQLDEAYIYGLARIEQNPVVIGVFDSHFMMGSMGSVVGEKVTKSIELAYLKKRPLILFTASGGARMQEGIYSLMQMAKTTSALHLLDKAGILYLTVLTDPTMGGVTASFAMLGDIILAEPQALIGFAGPRVIKQTIKETLPNAFQTSEFLLEKGFIDAIVPRQEMKNTLGRILDFHA